MNKHYKNFILCGEIDYYCLLCQETFGNEAAVEKHLRWETHRKSIKIQEYLPKFKKDRIYKIKDSYYCELCNLVTLDVADHIKGDYHEAQKVAPQMITKKSSLVQRENDSTVKIKDKAVSKLSWHGIKDGACSLCGTNVNDVDDHLLSITHMVNLIQSSVKCNDNYCYRELKSEKFYCFTCFETYENKYLASHWTDNHRPKNVKSSNDNNNTKTKETKCDTNNNVCNTLLNILAETEAKYYKINVKTKLATCLECGALVDANTKALNKHRSVNHQNSDEEFDSTFYFDHGKRRSELAKYGKENYIKLNESGSKGFCSLCNKYVAAHMKCAKQHVEGGIHSGFLELKGFIKDRKHEKPPNTVTYKSFAEVTFGPFCVAEYRVIVVNRGICVDILSYTLIGLIKDFRGNKGKCFACDVTIKVAEIPRHYKKKEHRKRVMECMVIPVEKEGELELVRQIPPGLYHCGFCNKVFPFWENMKKHLKSMPHKLQKTKHRMLSAISAKVYMNPSEDIEDMDEYVKLRKVEQLL